MSFMCLWQGINKLGLLVDSIEVRSLEKLGPNFALTAQLLVLRDRKSSSYHDQLRHIVTEGHSGLAHVVTAVCAPGVTQIPSDIAAAVVADLLCHSR